MQSYARHGSFLNSLEGLRAIAALGIVLTHVAFQTGMPPATFLGGVLARFDFFVSVFFALSAFLLWRRWGVQGAQDVQGVGDARRGWRDYYFSRAARILPLYLVCVATVLLLFPDVFGAPLPAVVANLTLTQIYLPAGLLPGLTHLWSLSVEVAFYLVLPLFAVALRRFSRRVRVLAISAVAVLSLGWGFVPLVAASPAPGVPNMQIFPPAFASWFAVGMLAAELEGVRLRGRLIWVCVSTAALILAAQSFFGPLGLVHPSPGEFARRVLAGAVFGAGVVVPVALAPGRYPVLASGVVRALGRWSYGIFLWHLPVLGVVFPLLGIRPFSGSFLIVAMTTIMLTIPISAATHSLIENPMKKLLSKTKKLT